jgi:DUF2934 family protein
MDTVGQRAHQIWEDRVENGIPGTPETDWAQAEEELSYLKAGADRLNPESEAILHREPGEGGTLPTLTAAAAR